MNTHHAQIISVPGIPNGFFEHIKPLYKFYYNTEPCKKALLKSYKNRNLKLELKEDRVDWTLELRFPIPGSNYLPVLAIPLAFLQYWASPSFQKQIQSKILSRVRQHMKTEKHLILMGHSHGANLWKAALDELIETGELMAYQKKGGKVELILMAPAFYGTMFGLTDFVLGKWKHGSSPKEVAKTLQALDGATLLRMKGDVLSGSLSKLPQGQWIAQDLALSKTDKLMTLLTLGSWSHTKIFHGAAHVLP